MRKLDPFLIPLYAALLAGCASVKQEAPLPLEPVPVEVRAEPRPTDYTIETMILDTSKQGRKLIFSDAEGNLPTVLNDPETEVMKFPNVYVTLGTNVVVDSRKIYEYPVEFDGTGKTNKFASRAVGRVINAGLYLTQEKSLVLVLAMRDSKLIKMEELKTPGDQTYQRPVCDVRKADAKVPVEPNRWMVISGDSVLVDKKIRGKIEPQRVWRVVLARVTPPTAPATKKP